MLDDPLPPPLLDNKDVEGNILRLIDSYDRSMPVDFFDIVDVVVTVDVGFLRVNEEYAFFFC